MQKSVYDLEWDKPTAEAERLQKENTDLQNQMQILRQDMDQRIDEAQQRVRLYHNAIEQKLEENLRQRDKQVIELNRDIQQYDHIVAQKEQTIITQANTIGQHKKDNRNLLAEQREKEIILTNTLRELNIAHDRYNFIKGVLDQTYQALVDDFLPYIYQNQVSLKEAQSALTNYQHKRQEDIYTHQPQPPRQPLQQKVRDELRSSAMQQTIAQQRQQDIESKVAVANSLRYMEEPKAPQENRLMDGLIESFAKTSLKSPTSSNKMHADSRLLTRLIL